MKRCKDIPEAVGEKAWKRRAETAEARVVVLEKSLAIALDERDGYRQHLLAVKLENNK